MYKLIQHPEKENEVIDIVVRLSDTACIPFAPDNADYQQFKRALQTGKNSDGTNLILQDATGTPMTSDQIAEFLKGLA
jgi:hypothetical protein